MTADAAAPAPSSGGDPASAEPGGDLAERGLTAEEVRQRTEAGQTNVTPRPGGRTTWDIVRGNTFTFFNGILGVLFVVMMVFGNWRDALFGWVIVINSGIGIYQEMRAKLVLDRLNLLTAPAAKVIRDGETADIPIAEVVLGDVVRVASGDQIVADGDVLVSRDLEVDESLLTGESVPVQKEAGRRDCSPAASWWRAAGCSSPPPWATTPTHSASPARASATCACTPTWSRASTGSCG